MVGGFSTSNYLFSKLVEHFSAKGIDVMRPDDYMWATAVYYASCPLTKQFCIRSKAVAEGAVIYKIDHVVASRISKYAYGIECCTVFDSSRADHLARKKNRFEAPSGQISISGCFKTILKKVYFALPCHLAANIFNRKRRLKRWRNLELLLPSFFPILRSTF